MKLGGTGGPQDDSLSVSALFSPRRWEGAAKQLKLSEREVQIARAFFDGEAEKEIAYRLKISRRTVHTHVERLYLKLHVHSRTELLGRLLFVLLGRPHRFNGSSHTL